MSMPTMRPEELRRRAAAALEATGLAPDDAADVSRALVQTSLRGVDSHGIRLLPTYLRALRGGRAVTQPQWAHRSSRPGVEVIDAGGALGIVAGLRATRRAIDLARAQGVGLVVVHGSNHFGAASVYTLTVVEAGMVGLAFSNADPLMVQAPGRAAALGTNPLSVAVPTDGHPFCLDMATSQVAWSRIQAEWRAHGQLPAGWAIDAEGIDCATPGAGPPAVAIPVGGYKGAALGLAVELLCAGLVGRDFGASQTHLYGPPWDTPRGVAHSVIAIDSAATGEPAHLRHRIGAMLAWYRSQPGGPAVPGDLEAACAKRRAEGIPIEAPVAAVLR